MNRAGGGVGILLRKGFTVSKTDWQPFSSMECMDLTISHGNVSVRLITVYRLQQSKKNQEATPNIFFRGFSSLLETVSITPGYQLLTGDYNFHMELLDNTYASMFRDLLESVGLTAHVHSPTHRSGHTLNVFIDRQNDQMLSNFKTAPSMPSDHYAVICSIAYPKPKPT